jgi:multidrug efflux pump subunit AcrA (membrane-fusion protein)
MSTKTLVAWGLVLAAAGGAYFVQKTYGKPAMDMAAPGGTVARAPVTVAQAEVVSLAETATYTGTVAAYAEEDVYPRVTGRILEMRVYPGDRVERGQIVARLDDVELGSKVREAAAGAAAAEANLAQMEADVAAARHGVIQMQKELAMAEAESGYQHSVAARDERLFAKGALAQQEAENSRAMAAASRAKVEAARAKLEQARAMEASALKKREAMAAMASQSQAMLRTNEVVRDYVNIRAASGGYVVKRLIAPGTLVQPGMAILKIAQIDRVRFQASVAERDVARLRVGSPVRVRVSGQEDRPLNLKATSIFPFAEGPSRTAVVEAIAENPDRRFLPGQYVAMELELGDRANVVSVPRGAVQRLGVQSYVWTLGNDTAVRRPVRPGPADAERVGILEGLQAGQQVIVAGHENLHEGVKVAIADGGSVIAAAGPGRPGTGGRGPQEVDAPAEDHQGHAMAAEREEAGRAIQRKDSMGRGAGAQVAQAPGSQSKTGGLRIELASIPARPRVGDGKLRIEVKDPAGAPVAGATVEVATGMAGMAGPKVAARPAREAGIYEATVNLGMAGAWTVDVVVARPQGGSTSAKFNLEVK